MSERFQKALSELMNDHNLDQIGIASLTSFSQPKISRLLSGASKPQASDFGAFFNAFHDPHDRFRLIHAYLQDELPPEAFAAIAIDTPSLPGLRDEPGTLILKALSLKGESAMRFLLSIIHETPQIEDVIIDLARAFGWSQTTPQPISYTKKHRQTKPIKGITPLDPPHKLNES